MLSHRFKKVNPAKLIQAINYTDTQTSVSLKHGKPYVTVYLSSGAVTVPMSRLRGCY